MRVSTKVQSEDGTSLDTQKQIGIKRSKKLGMDYVIHNEGGKSSYKDDLTNRPVMRTLLDGMEKGVVKNLFVYNTDRLSRKRTTWYLIRLKIEKCRVKLYIGDSSELDTDDKLESLFFGVMTEISQYENETRRDRSRLGKIEKFKSGIYIHGTIPFGFGRENGILTKHPKDTETLTQIFRMFQQGRSTKEIGNWLLSIKVRTPRGNLVWTSNQLRKMLGNRTYIGETHYNDKLSNRTYNGTCVKLIDDKLWYSVQQRLKETSRIEQQRRNLKHDYLLTSFLRCGVCGSICRGKTNPKIYMNLYFCGGTENRWRDSRVPECDKHRSKSVNVKKCDDLVWETLLDTIEKSTTLKQDFKDTMLGENLERVEDKEFEINNIILNKNREKKKVKSRLDTLENKRLELQRTYFLDEMDKDDYMTIGLDMDLKMDRVKGDLDGIEEDLVRLNESSTWIDWITEYGGKVEKYRKLKSMEEKRKVLGQFLNKVEVDYDIEQRLHNLKLYLRLPLFDDEYVVVGKDRYGRRITEVKGGKKQKMLKLPTSKHDSRGSKKKDQFYEVVSSSNVRDTEHYNTKPINHSGVSLLCRISAADDLDISTEYDAFLVYKIQIKSGNLWNSRLSDKQISIYKLIKKLRSESMTYKQIADYLNERNMTTARGCKFSDSGVHSAEKKMERRFKKQEREEIKITDMRIRFDKKS